MRAGFIMPIVNFDLCQEFYELHILAMLEEQNQTPQSEARRLFNQAVIDEFRAGMVDRWGLEATEGLIANYQARIGTIIDNLQSALDD
jgi:hypothetical protein